MNLMVLQLKSDDYLIADVEQMDEEPSCYLKNCYKIVECAEYGSEPEDLEKRAYSLEGTHLKISARKIDEGAAEKDWYVYEYVILQKYPKYSKDNEALIYSNKLLTISEPTDDLVNLYTKVTAE